LTIVLMATATLASGCATVGTTRAIATPWGAAGLHTFAPEKNASEPNARKVDAQVAQLLNDVQRAQNIDEGTRVASR